MSILNALVGRVGPSATLVISEKAAALKRQGKDVLNLSVGEPDTLIPQWVRKAAIQAIEDGQHLYTPVAGMPALRQAILDKLQRDNHLSGWSADQVVVSCGAKQVIYSALMASIRPGDEVIIPAPYWVSYPAITGLAQGIPIIVPCGPGFKLTAEALSKAVTPRSRWVILNSPNNPTGAVYTHAELAALAEVLHQHPHVWILSDDIYESLTYEEEFASILHCAPSLRERTLVVNGVSKSFSMTGWRIGYGVGPTELIQGMITLQSQSTSGACCIAQSAALAALQGGEGPAFLAEQRALFRQRRDLLVQGLATMKPLSVLTPPGAFYLYVDCKALLPRTTSHGQILTTDVQLAEAILEEALISCVPGAEFGLPGYVRFSYAVDEATLHKAIDRLAQWVNNRD